MKIARYFLLVSLLCMFACPSALAGDSSFVGPQLTISLFTGQEMAFDRWVAEDKNHMVKMLGEYPACPGRVKAVVFEEWQAIVEEMRRVSLTEAFSDREYGFWIYPAPASGKLHVLGAAKKSRENFLCLAREGTLAAASIEQVYPDLSIGSSRSTAAAGGTVRFQAASPDQYPGVEETAAALRAMKVPKGVLNGYTVYLMPYIMEGLRGYSFSQGLPVVEESSYISSRHEQSEQGFPATAVAHEFGHFLHQQYLGEYTAGNRLWNEYLRVRGDRHWVEGAWEKSTMENFAEDVRVTLGPPEARQVSYAADYGDPARTPGLKDTLEQVFEKLPAQAAKAPLDFGFVNMREEGGGAGMLLVNGLEACESMVVSSGRLVATASYIAGDPEARPAVSVQGEGFRDDCELEPTAEGILDYTVDLPGPGKYRLALGALKDGTLTVYKIVNVEYVPLDYVLSDEEMQKYGFTTVNDGDAPYLDLQGHWAKQDISGLLRLKAVNGYPDNTFRPDFKITRAEFLKLLVGTAGFGPANKFTQPDFTDIQADHWAGPYLATAVDLGIVDPEEYPDGLFEPDKPVTRGEMAAWLSRALARAKPHLRITNSVGLGLITGYPDHSYRFEATSTRAEAARVLTRMIEIHSHKTG